MLTTLAGTALYSDDRLAAGSLRPVEDFSVKGAILIAAGFLKGEQCWQIRPLDICDLFTFLQGLRTEALITCIMHIGYA